MQDICVSKEAALEVIMGVLPAGATSARSECTPSYPSRNLSLIQKVLCGVEMSHSLQKFDLLGFFWGGGNGDRTQDLMVAR